MKSDITRIKASPNVLVFADKARKIYELPPQDYRGLLNEDIAGSYKKSTNRLENAINMEATHCKVH